MDFWKAYFAIVEVLKTKVFEYEKILNQFDLTSVSEVPMPRSHSVHTFPVFSGGQQSSRIHLTLVIIEPTERNRILISRYLTPRGVKIKFVTTESEARALQDFDLSLDSSAMSFPADKERLLSWVQQATLPESSPSH